MIVWLASYPRSGNTLLRTVLKQSLGIGTYSDEQIKPIVGLTDSAKESFGNLSYGADWNSFYKLASDSNECFLVKTHLPPRDEQPTIYVIRDGRAATESYAAYHRAFRPNSEYCPSILDLMVGDDYYGDWSSHFYKWNERRNSKLLVVRFEDLVNANEILVGKLQSFLGMEVNAKPFINPIKDQRRENPNFFRHGSITWKSTVDWTDKLEALFIAVHGDLMAELGYITSEELDDALRQMDKETCNLGKLARKGFMERNGWLFSAQEKEVVIQSLVQRLNENTQ